MLRATAIACESMAAAIVPPNGAISDRYRRAAARWPTAPAPSYEQLASLAERPARHGERAPRRRLALPAHARHGPLIERERRSSGRSDR
jgi:hypothetical protein